MAGEEKTEKATARKRREAREKEGNVLQSKEITTVVFIFGIFMILFLFGKYIFQLLLNSIKDWLELVGRNDITVNEEFMTENAVDIITVCAMTLGPLLLSAIILGVSPTLIQTKGLFNTRMLRPKFSKLNPFTGIKRLFSLHAFVNILKGLVEISVVLIIVYNKIMGLVGDIMKLPDMEIMQGVIFAARSVFEIVMLVCIVFVFVAAADYIFQWWSYEKKLKMSKQEVKDEYKQMEGDPKIKAKIKQKQREIAQGRMMGEVPTSDVVVRNPTHYAVALRYNPENVMSVPIVTAKGQGHIALKIIELAEENDVFIKEDRPLARTLYEAVEIGHEIPVELFNAIAVVLSEMYEAKGINPKLPANDKKKPGASPII